MSQPGIVAECAEALKETSPGAMGDKELLTLLFGSEHAAHAMMKFNIRRLDQVPTEELDKLLSQRQSWTLQAAMELGRRLWTSKELPMVRGPEVIFELCEDIRKSKREHFVGFYLNSRNQVIHREVISIGSLNASIVHPREVFIPALAHSAASLVLAHNHPSGTVEPSEEDLAITRRLTESGRLLGIDLLDHVIVAAEAYTSFKERKLLR